MIDEHCVIMAKDGRAWPFRLDARQEIALSVSVNHGDEIDVYLMTKQQHSNYARDIEYRYFGDASGEKTRSVDFQGVLDEGEYVLVARNPTWGILSEGKSKVRVTLKAKPNAVQEVHQILRDATPPRTKPLSRRQAERVMELWSHMPDWVMIAGWENLVNEGAANPLHARLVPAFLFSIRGSGNALSRDPEESAYMGWGLSELAADYLGRIGPAGKPYARDAVRQIMEAGASSWEPQGWLRHFVRGLRSMGYSDSELAPIWAWADEVGIDEQMQRYAGRPEAP